MNELKCPICNYKGDYREFNPTCVKVGTFISYYEVTCPDSDCGSKWTTRWQD